MPGSCEANRFPARCSAHRIPLRFVGTTSSSRESDLSSPHPTAKIESFLGIRNFAIRWKAATNAEPRRPRQVSWVGCPRRSSGLSREATRSPTPRQHRGPASFNVSPAAR